MLLGNTLLFFLIEFLILCRNKTASANGCFDKDLIIISVGTQGLRDLLNENKSLFKEKNIPIILCMKGIEIKTGFTPTKIVKDILGENYSCGAWIGPGHVQDFTNGIPNCMVIDSDDRELVKKLVDSFSSNLIRFYYGTNLLGNEIGAASKNVIGIAAGMLDGFNLSSLKGALMSRGTREIARLIEKMGGDKSCAYGLCHLGDYEATVFSDPDFSAVTSIELIWFGDFLAFIAFFSGVLFT